MTVVFAKKGSKAGLHSLAFASHGTSGEQARPGRILAALPTVALEPSPTTHLAWPATGAAGKWGCSTIGQGAAWQQQAGPRIALPKPWPPN